MSAETPEGDQGLIPAGWGSAPEARKDHYWREGEQRSACGNWQRLSGEILVRPTKPKAACAACSKAAP